MSAAAPRKRGRPRDETLQARREEEILDAATRLFARHGFSQTDLDSVALALGVGKGTLYRYFPSKRELFLAAVDRGMRRLMDAVNASAARAADPLDRIVEAIRTYLAFFDRHPELVELFIQERAQFKGRAQPTYFAHQEANAGPWQAMYDRLVAEGRVRALPTAPDRDVVGDLLYGTILANYFAHRPASHEDQAQSIVDVVFYGILTDAERRRRPAPRVRKRKGSTTRKARSRPLTARPGVPG
jgi:AcrR family transcriptional regulator